MAKKLTLKQAKFVQEYIENGGNGVRAAQKAYPKASYSTASVIAYENLRKPNISQVLEPMLEKHGISIDNAIRPLGKALKAKKVTPSGSEVDDLTIQLQASDRVIKLLSMFRMY